MKGKESLPESELAVHVFVAVHPCSNETPEEEGRFSIVLFDGGIHREREATIVRALAGSSHRPTKY
jgi:hypothetical protein